MRQAIDRLSMVLGLVVPLALVVLFFSQHREYPFPDASEYFLPTQRYWQIAKGGHPWATVSSMYMDRVWKPVALPSLWLPFFTLADGDVRAAVSLAGITMFGGCLVYLTLLVRLFASGLMAGLIVSYIGVVPWFQRTAMLPQTEVAFAFFFFAASYHFFRSDELRERRHALAGMFWLILSLDVRPDLSFISLVPLFAWGLTRALKREKVTLKRASIFAPLLLLAFAVPIPPIVVQLEYPKGAIAAIAILCLILAIGQMIMARRLEIAGFLAAISTLPVLFTVLWYLPFTYRTYYWMYECTFGGLAQRTGGNAGRSLSGVPVVLPITLGLLGWFASRKRTASRVLITGSLRVWVTFSLAASCLIFAAGALSYNFDTRYQIVFLISLMAASLVFGFRLVNRKLAWGGGALLALWTLWQAFAIFATMEVVRSPEMRNLGALIRYSEWSGVFSLSHPAAATSTADLLLNQLEKSLSTKEATLITVLPRDLPEDPARDFWRMTLAAHDRNWPWRFWTTQSVPKESSIDGAWSAAIEDGHCILLVGPSEGKPELRWHPSVAALTEFLLTEKSETFVRARGWRLDAQISVRYAGSFGTYFLYKRLTDVNSKCGK